MSLDHRLVHVVEARGAGGFRVWLRFDDGAVGTVDLEGELQGEVFEFLRDPSFFAQLRIGEGRTLEWPPRPFHRGTLAGGAIFGLGWALSGACPGVIFTQIGEGKLYALLSLAGVFAGNALYGALFERRPASPATTSAAQRA